jgi:hypothetical protein
MAGCGQFHKRRAQVTRRGFEDDQPVLFATQGLCATGSAGWRPCLAHTSRARAAGVMRVTAVSLRPDARDAKRRKHPHTYEDVPGRFGAIAA